MADPATFARLFRTTPDPVADHLGGVLANYSATDNTVSEVTCYQASENSGYPQWFLGNSSDTHGPLALGAMFSTDIGHPALPTNDDCKWA